MISVLVYGRNDSYGYNLQKRAAVSLNCIAELLDAPDDEIIFVDYNSPDDLPTFVEAIRDLLTPRVRELLRVIRVRSEHHERFASRTHLRVLESQARNAGLRRSNPKNRWILSTNTDIVFTSLSGRSLSTIVGELADGFYHTPRFEVPEILWETLDRTNPRDCIAKISEWGRRFQLNEVVFGWSEAIFDGPGDFQLFLRDDAFKIDGFDERMLWGWHIDSSLARRLSLLRGERVQSAVHLVYAYHCDHNRETTPNHSHGATQNSWDEFVLGAKHPEIPEQRESWGFADAALEELDLAEPPRIIAALEGLISPMRGGPYVTGLIPELFDDLRYDPEHVIPYLANAIGALPRAWSVGYAGCRQQMFNLFLKLWTELGFRGRVLVPTTIAGASLVIDSAAPTDVVEPGEFYERPNFFIFENGAASDDDHEHPTGARRSPLEGARAPTQGDLARISRVRREFVRAATAERELPRSPRRFVLINARYNAFEAACVSRIGTSAVPYGTRTNHGFLLPQLRGESKRGPIDWFCSKLTGPWRPRRRDVEAILDAARLEKIEINIVEATRVASHLISVLKLSEAPDALGIDRARLERFIAKIESQRPSRKARASLGLQVAERAGKRRGLSRIAAIEDFDDPEWREWSRRVHGVAAESWLTRGRTKWESTHILFSLDRTRTLSGRVALLVDSDPARTFGIRKLSAALGDWTGSLDLFDITGSLPGEPAYDAVTIESGAAVRFTTTQFPAILATADRALRVDGTCIIVLEVVLSESDPQAFHVTGFEGGRFDDLIDTLTGWRFSGPFEGTITADTLDTLGSGRVASFDALENIDSRRAMPLVWTDLEGRLRSSAILVYRKVAQTSAEDWERFHHAFNAPPSQVELVATTSA